MVKTRAEFEMERRIADGMTFQEQTAIPFADRPRQKSRRDLLVEEQKKNQERRKEASQTIEKLKRQYDLANDSLEVTSLDEVEEIAVELQRLEACLEAVRRIFNRCIQTEESLMIEIRNTPNAELSEFQSLKARQEGIIARLSALARMELNPSEPYGKQVDETLRTLAVEQAEIAKILKENYGFVRAVGEERNLEKPVHG